MHHIRPSWWRRQTDRYPWLPNAAAVGGVLLSIAVIMMLLLWVSTQRITGVG